MHVVRKYWMRGWFFCFYLPLLWNEIRRPSNSGDVMCFQAVQYLSDFLHREQMIFLPQASWSLRFTCVIWSWNDGIYQAWHQQISYGSKNEQKPKCTDCVEHLRQCHCVLTPITTNSASKEAFLDIGVLYQLAKCYGFPAPQATSISPTWLPFTTISCRRVVFWHSTALSLLSRRRGRLLLLKLDYPTTLWCAKIFAVSALHKVFLARNIS